MFDLSHFYVKGDIENKGSQNYSMFQPIYPLTMPTCDTETIIAWKSEGLSDEIIKPAAAPGDSHAPKLK